MDEYIKATIVTYHNRIAWTINKYDPKRSDGNFEFVPIPNSKIEGCENLESTNGDFMSLLSNVMTKVSNQVFAPIDEWHCRKG